MAWSPMDNPKLRNTGSILRTTLVMFTPCTNDKIPQKLTSSISPDQPSYLTFSSGLGEKVVCVCTWGGRRDATAYHTQHGTGSLADCTCTRREQLRAWGQNVLQLSEPIWLKLTVRIFIYVIHNRESLLRYRYIPGPPKRTTPLSPYSQHKHGCWRPRKNPYIFGFLMESM